jgi:transposase
MFRIAFSQQTVKRLKHELDKAYGRGDTRGVRRVSVLLMLGSGMVLERIVAIWNISQQSVYHWRNEFLAYGWDSLEYERGAGRPARLSKSQKRQLSQWIEAGPESCGYGTGCWTSVLIQDLIHQKFHTLYNRFYVCELLRNLGFSFQKARFVSDHLDQEARQCWLETEWPRILSQARRSGAHLFFGDEASFALWGSLSYTWALKGHQPQVRTTGVRKGYKVFGAIDFFSGRLIYQGTEARFRSDTYQAFLQHLLAQVSGPIILIQDGARYHTSRSTREFIAHNQARLRVYQLPSYSPDYNPIEHLWKKIKTQVTHNRYFAEFVKLVQSVEEALKLLATQSAEILRLMGFYTHPMAEAIAS